MDDERIDLSSLDPSRDESRWNEMIDRVTARAVEARARRPAASPIALQVLAWARPTLALAAALVLVVWAVALTMPATGSPEAATARRTEPAFALSTWAMQGDVPTTADVLETLGGDHVEP